MHSAANFLIICFAGLNLLTFAYYGWDKFAAKRNYDRVPEKRLLLMAFLGGSIGAKIAQRTFRHKTWKQPFASRLNTIIAIHLAVPALIAGLYVLPVVQLLLAGE